jgi:hypothetical protein
VESPGQGTRQQYALLDDLIGSDDFAAMMATQMKTFDILGSRSFWTADTKGTGTAMNTNWNPQ